jgi:capsular polysaccharide transport system permease protein
MSDAGTGGGLTTLRPPAFRGSRIILALILREMGATYGRSPGGYVWAVIGPLGAIAMLSFAFSFIVRSPALGTSFMLFYATGYLPYDLFNQTMVKITGSLRYSRALLAYPGVSWVHAVAARVMLGLLTFLMVFVIVLAGIMIAVETRSTLKVGPIIDGLAMGLFIGLGIGLINAVLMGLFQAWERLWVILTRPLFLISGIFYIYEDLPRFAQDILWWNPLIHVTALVRSGIYPTYDAEFASEAYGYGTGLTLVAVGLLMMRRTYRVVLER